LIVLLNRSGDGTVSIVEAVLADGGGTELLITGCVDGMGGASCSTRPLMDLVGAGSLDAGSSRAPGTGLLAAWFSVAFSAYVEMLSTIAAMLALSDLSICSVARFDLSTDLWAAFAVLAVGFLQVWFRL